MKQMFEMRCCMDVVSLVHGLSRATVYVRRPWWTMLVHSVVQAFSSPIAFRRQANCCTSWFEPVHVRELNIIMLFGGCCGVISASAGDSTDSTCSPTFVRCVVEACSSSMSQLASLTSMSLSRIRLEPTREARQRADRYQPLVSWIFSTWQ